MSIDNERMDRFTSEPEDFEILEYNIIERIRIGNVLFVQSEDNGFTYDAYRDDLPDNPIAWVILTDEGVEVHTWVGVEYYTTLEAAAEAIKNYK